MKVLRDNSKKPLACNPTCKVVPLPQDHPNLTPARSLTLSSATADVFPTTVLHTASLSNNDDELSLCCKCLPSGHLASVCTRKLCPHCNEPHVLTLWSQSTSPNVRTKTITMTMASAPPSQKNASVVATAVRTPTVTKPAHRSFDEPVAISSCCKTCRLQSTRSISYSGGYRIL